MLYLTIPAVEDWDNEKEEFVITKKAVTLQLEHSLVSLSKWESNWCKPFLTQDTKTYEETIDYIRCMTITQNVDSSVYDRITDDNIKRVNEYISAKKTATWFSERKGRKGGRRTNEVTTSELIYFWMISYNIPFKCEKWHLSRLLTLIQVCENKNSTNGKMKMNDIYSTQSSLNEARKKALRSKG